MENQNKSDINSQKAHGVLICLFCFCFCCGRQSNPDVKAEEEKRSYLQQIVRFVMIGNEKKNSKYIHISENKHSTHDEVCLTITDNSA